MLHLKYIDSNQYVKNGYYFGTDLEVLNDFCRKFLDVDENEFYKDEVIRRYLDEVCHAEFFLNGYMVRDKPLYVRSKEWYVTSFSNEILLTIMMLHFYRKKQCPFVLQGLIPAWDDLVWIAQNKDLDMTIYIMDHFEYAYDFVRNHLRDFNFILKHVKMDLDVTWKDEYFSSWDEWEKEDGLW